MKWGGNFINIYLLENVAIKLYTPTNITNKNLVLLKYSALDRAVIWKHWNRIFRTKNSVLSIAAFDEKLTKLVEVESKIWEPTYE